MDLAELSGLLFHLQFLKHCFLKRKDSQIKFLYFYTFANTRGDIFDFDFFRQAFNFPICAKVYDIDPVKYESLIDLNDNLDSIQFENDPIPKLFCSEVVLSVDFLENAKFLDEINVAEKYRIRGRMAHVFDYVNLMQKNSKILYFKIMLKDLLACCEKVGFYPADASDFELITTES